MFHCVTTCANKLFMLKRELKFLPTASAVILTPVAVAACTWCKNGVLASLYDIVTNYMCIYLSEL